MEHQEKFNQQIKAIFKGGRIRPIKWGADQEEGGWNSWSVDEKLKYAMDLASAMNQAADALQDERNELLEKAKGLEEQLNNCEKNLSIQKNTLVAALNNHNDRNQRDAKAIQDLQTRVRAQDALIEQLNGDNG